MGISQERSVPQTQGRKLVLKDSLQASKPSLSSDSLLKASLDSVSRVSAAKPKSNKIDAEVNYSAQDSIVFYGDGTGYLHGQSDITYKNINLKADFVRVKMDSSLIFARGTTDSLGTKIGEPVFKEGESEYTSKELTYNLQTKKGYIRQAVTQQGEGYIIADRTKKTTEDILCMAGGKYTTCENHDHPDFYLQLTKGKVKPGEYIVAGPAYLVVCDVPLPLAVPFGFFPFSNKYSSGILMPSYEDEMNRGFGLTNGGYYFALSDYGDLELRGEIWTKGTWALNASSTYLKRYKYRGSFNFSYREDVTGEKDMSDYSKAKNLSIRWTHSQDAKANPYFTFSSSVNFSTSGYNRSNINNYNNPELNSQSTTQSSVSFSKRFPNSPFSITGSMSVTQRAKDSTLSMSLPNISISMSRIYPFKRKNPVGNERWYEKISMSYTGTIQNSIDNVKENKLLTSSFSNDWKNGMLHKIPIGATFNLLKYINITPAFNYTERWYLKSVNQSYDEKTKTVVTETEEGFKRVYDFDMSLSASTKLYGFYMPIRSIFGDKIDRIRHVITPTIGLSYRPDFGDSKWGYYGTYTKPVTDTDNPDVVYQEVVQYSHYANSLYGTPGTGKSGNVNFSLSNNLEMKVRNDGDTTGVNPFKKVSLIDNFSVSGSYNMAADSMNWSYLSANLRLKIKSYTLSLSGSFDPYMYGLDAKGNYKRINKLRWENGMFPRFMGTGTSYSYTLNNETFKKLFGKDKGGDKNKPQSEAGDQDNLTEKPEDKTLNNSAKTETDKNQKSEMDLDGYEKVNIPWSISISYNIRYADINEFDEVKMVPKMGFTHGLSLSGNLSLAQWKFSSNVQYDFKAKQFSYTNINVSRSLHCWTMTGSFVPFGRYKSYNFHIGVNASMLQDLKYDKQSGYSNTNVTWY